MKLSQVKASKSIKSSDYKTAERELNRLIKEDVTNQYQEEVLAENNDIEEDVMMVQKFNSANIALSTKSDFNQDNFNKFEKDDRLEFELLKACTNNNLKAFNMLMSENVDVNKCNSFKQVPIMFALQNGNIKMVERLIEKGAKVNGVDTNGNSTLLYALTLDYKLDKDLYFEENREKAINLILSKLTAVEKNNMINLQNDNGISPLHLACHFSFNKIIKNLLENGANPNLVDCMGKTPLTHCYRVNSTANDELLIQYGANVNDYEFPNRKSALFNVLASNMPEREKKMFAHKLIGYGASIEGMGLELEMNQDIAEGVKMQALKYMKQYLVKNLEQKNDDTAKVFVSTENFDALFEYLVRKHSFNDARVLCQMGYDLNVVEKKTKNTRLIMAVLKDDIEYAKFLIKNGALLNMRNNENKTALHIALENNSLGIAKMLLKCDAHMYPTMEQFNELVKKFDDKYYETLKRHSVILKVKNNSSCYNYTAPSGIERNY